MANPGQKSIIEINVRTNDSELTDIAATIPLRTTKLKPTIQNCNLDTLPSNEKNSANKSLTPPSEFLFLLGGFGFLGMVLSTGFEGAAANVADDGCVGAAV